jgi:hypothetical protein
METVKAAAGNVCASDRVARKWEGAKKRKVG